MRRHVAKILALYLLYLAVIPCLDDYSISFCQSEGIVHIEESHSDCHADMCSPLCNCLCCNTIVLPSCNFELNENIASFDLSAVYQLDFLPFSLIPASPPPKA